MSHAPPPRQDQHTRNMSSFTETSERPQDPPPRPALKTVPPGRSVGRLQGALVQTGQSALKTTQSFLGEPRSFMKG
ncbi:hypothetical protein EYF80_053588 [Liparis tanakae]|uniref:Uncharacterized protein n=1 Tax=Liparis tanakae TaxID=230148 RepID=A0A4Z2F564_9TELE|nr:hypothetical protein EYF80_053588 [Liparis tanakae]